MNRNGRGAVAILLVAGVLQGCVGGEDERAAEAAALAEQSDDLATHLESQPKPSADGPAVIVQLAFGPEADLDLYVTDPLLETVYFARHESRTGGRIGADVRCDTPGERIEEVRFAAPWPGRYRVGIDHPRRCDDEPAPAPAAYAVTARVDSNTYRAQGTVDLERFEVIVLEFELQEGSADEQRLEFD
ncbi:MAG: hypothetical protein OES38_03255 [Gammaproteobacteria bacterium]|nr:hypothetical protein [Gammaproteobacteria bacterium]